MAKEAPGDPKPLLKRQRMWKPNVRPSSPKLCVLAGDAMSGKIKRGSSTLLKTMLMMGGLGDSDGNSVIKRRLGSSRTSHTSRTAVLPGTAPKRQLYLCPRWIGQGGEEVWVLKRLKRLHSPVKLCHQTHVPTKK